MRLEIGGGHLCPPDAINLDPVHGVGDWLRYAQQMPWPVVDGGVTSIRASHVMEHVPAGAERIAVFNEAHRVLAPGGTFEIIVPLFPSWQAMADPTHVSYWVEQSFAYFDGRLTAQADYGLRFWTTLHWSVSDGWEGHWIGVPQ